MTDTLEGYVRTMIYRYITASGRYLFAKERWELRDARSSKRSKQFRYWDPSTHTRRKPAGADDLLYRMPQVAEGIDTKRSIHWTEGEKDADAVATAGAVATSHHQGAGHATYQQALSLSGAKRVILWVDKDAGHWEVGAYDACVRYNHLMRAGFRPSQVLFVRALVGKDAWDHLHSGLSLATAVPVDRLRLAEVASGFTPRKASAIGYRRG